MRFVKMHGLGNDFVLLNGFQPLEIDDPNALARRLCDRHFGIGADGLIIMVPSDKADAKMCYYNSDGSAAEMCGNGLRCAARFVLDEGICFGTSLLIETLAGLLTVTVTEKGLTADMGCPELAPEKIPVAAPSNRVTAEVDGHTLHFYCVSMGNPHAVTFDLYPDDDTFRHIAPKLEHHPLFPAKANIEFCKMTDSGIDVHVWERGDGETLACGTGACAVLTAAADLGLTGQASDIRLPGGTLHIEWLENGHILMTGPAERVFVGEI